MLNFFKDKEAIKFVDLTISNIEYIKRLSHELICFDGSNNLSKNSNAIEKSYIATYLFLLTEILGNSFDKERMRNVRLELSKKLDSDILQLLDNVKNHVATLDIPYVKQSCSWIINKINLKGALKALAIAHQYVIFTEILNSQIWKSIGLTNYSTDGIIESFAARFSEKDIVTKVLLWLIFTDVQEVQAYEKYKEIENNNTKSVIRNLENILQNTNISDNHLIEETITRCDLIHHYARGIGNHMTIIGERMQKNCSLLARQISMQHGLH